MDRNTGLGGHAAGGGNSQRHALVIRMFAAIGLPVKWCPRARACRSWNERIVVTLAAAAPRRLSEYALAEAHAFEGRTIRLYCDRMPAASSGWIAHVLAHEITHLLQTCDHHSPTGVRKARWDARDHAAMKMGALAFTADDLNLIRAGLQKRRNLGHRALLAVR